MQKWFNLIKNFIKQTCLRLFFQLSCRNVLTEKNRGWQGEEIDVKTASLTCWRRNEAGGFSYGLQLVIKKREWKQNKTRCCFPGFSRQYWSEAAGLEDPAVPVPVWPVYALTRLLVSLGRWVESRLEILLGTKMPKKVSFKQWLFFLRLLNNQNLTQVLLSSSLSSGLVWISLLTETGWDWSSKFLFWSRFRKNLWRYLPTCTETLNFSIWTYRTRTTIRPGSLLQTSVSETLRNIVRKYRFCLVPCLFEPTWKIKLVLIRWMLVLVLWMLVDAAATNPE